MRYLGVIILALLSVTAKAETPEDETYARMGLGVFNSAVDSRAEVKSVAVGYNKSLFMGLRTQYEFQGWLDDRRDLGRSSGGMLSGSIGVDVNPGYFFFSTYVGLGVKLPNDSLLGGPIQFVETFTFGVRDKKQNSFGLFYNHISSAGIFRPNVGRDFIGVKVGVPF